MTLASSLGLTPRKSSSTFDGACVWRVAGTAQLTDPGRCATPAQASMRAVVSRRTPLTSCQPTRRRSPRRCDRTQPAGSRSQSCSEFLSEPSAALISSHRRWSSSACRMVAAMKALRRRRPTPRVEVVDQFILQADLQTHRHNVAHRHSRFSRPWHQGHGGRGQVLSVRAMGWVNWSGLATLLANVAPTIS